MIEQEVEWQLACRPDPVEPKARLTDIELAIEAIIEITRREWMSQGSAFPTIGEAAADRPRFAHPLIRFALDAKRSNAWRARRMAGADAMPGTERRRGSGAEVYALEFDSE